MFLSRFFVILSTFFRLLLRVYSWPRLVRNLQFWRKSCAAQKDAFYIHPSFQQNSFCKKTAFLNLWLDRAIPAKLTGYMSGWMLEHSKTCLTKFIVSINTLNHSMMLCKKIDKIEFVQGVHFEFIHSSKNNCTKYLLSFDDSCAEICQSMEFLDIATACRHRGFSTKKIKHNLLYQSKLGKDVELQNTHYSFQVTSRCASSCYIKCTVGTWINSRWLVLGRIVCNFWSLIDWFVSANRRSLTLLHKWRKFSIKTLCTRKLEAFETFGRWTH